MFNLLSKILFWLFRLFIGITKTIYSGFVGFLRITIMAVICMTPSFWLIFGLKDGNPFFIVYLVGALVWPIVFYAILLFIVRAKRNSVGYRNANNTSTQYASAADELLYGSNQPLYSPMSLVNSEIPYTNEHFAKYGSMD